MSATDLSPATLEDFADAWQDFFRAVRRAKGHAAQAGGPGLSLAQYHLVEPLLDGEARCVGRLALDAGVAQPTATRMLDGLGAAGHVERRTDPGDRRLRLVALTPSGLAAADEKRAAIADARRRLFEALPEELRGATVEALKRFAAVMEDL